MTMMTRRFRLIEQYFAILISILVIGIFYDLLVIGTSILGKLLTVLSSRLLPTIPPSS